MNLNKAFIIGNLTRDPEARTLPSGQAITTFSVATNRMWTDKQGQKQQHTEFHNVVLFGRIAEIAQQYLQKGKAVFIEGRIQTRTWESQDGSRKWRTEIIGENMQLGPRLAGGGANQSTEGRASIASSPTPHQPQPPQQQQQEEIATIEYPEESEGDDVDPSKIPF